MPELPEVETVVRQLNALIAGRTIRQARLLREKLAPECSSKNFSSILQSSSVNGVSRRGKFILINLSREQTLLVHLRMSGRFMLLDEEAAEPKFTHAVFHLDDETKLIFQDQRHFGLMKIVSNGDLFNVRELSKLAPEPFSDEFSPEYLRSSLQRSRRSLKETLLDQTRVCGLGNIYASEAMFIARADPRMSADGLSAIKTKRLHSAIRDVMTETLEIGKSIAIDRENIGGNIYGNGSAQIWRVYGREGEPCSNCDRPIRRIVQAARSTFFCPYCQR